MLKRNRALLPPSARGALQAVAALAPVGLVPVGLVPVGLALLGLLGSVGCRQPELRAVAVISETGPLGPYGKEIRRGMEIAEEHVTGPGGPLEGQSFTIEYVDPGSDPDAAVEAVTAALETKPLVIFGPLDTEAFLRLGFDATEAETVLMTPWNGAPLANRGFSTSFRVFPSHTAETNRIAAYMRREVKPGIKDLILLTAIDDHGRFFKPAFVQSFRRLGGTIERSENFEPVIDAERAAVLVEELRTKPGDAVLVNAIGQDAVEVIRALAAIEYRGRVFTTSAFHHAGLREAAGEAANGVVYVAPKFPVEVSLDPDDPPAALLPHERFPAGYRVRHGDEPTLWAALGYDAVHSVAQTVERMGGPFRADLGVNLRAITFEAYSVFGKNAWDDAGELRDRDLAVYVVQDGKAAPPPKPAES